MTEMVRDVMNDFLACDIYLNVLHDQIHVLQFQQLVFVQPQNRVRHGRNDAFAIQQINVPDTQAQTERNLKSQK